MRLWASFTARKHYFLSSVVVLVLDQFTKILAHWLLRGRGPVEIVPGFLNLWYSRNRGGLFGFFGSYDEPWRTALLTLFPLIAIVAIALFLARTDEPDRSTLFGMAMILGGAAGNLIDRIFRGEVVDFLDVYASSRSLADWLIAKFGTHHWPTFNIADSAIVVGACLLILDIVRPDRRKAATAGNPD